VGKGDPSVGLAGKLPLGKEQGVYECYIGLTKLDLTVWSQLASC